MCASSFRPDRKRTRFLTAGESIILHGPVGVGKTFIAQAIGHHACRHGHTVAFTKTSRLLADLAGGHADRTWNTRLRRWARTDLIVLDDFAMRDFTPAQADDLYELITERASRSTVITANRRPEDWYPLFPNPVVAESVLDRLINTAHHIHMNGRSYRPNKRPGQPTPHDRTPDHRTARHRAGVRLLERRDIDAALSLLADDCEYDNVPIGKLHGRDAVWDALTRFIAPASEVEWVTLREAETGAVVFNERIDRFHMPFGWVELPVAGVWEVNDGRITLWRDYFDLQSFTEQMAARPAGWSEPTS